MTTAAYDTHRHPPSSPSSRPVIWDAYCAGLDRIISARMQGRVGPAAVCSPYYDVRKLIEKDDASPSTPRKVPTSPARLVFALIAGGIFYSGGNLLLSVFVITLSGLFFIVAAYSTRSRRTPRSARTRETLQVMSVRAHGAAHGRGLLPWPPAPSTWPQACSSSTRPLSCTNIWLVFLGVLVRPHHQAAQVALRPVACRITPTRRSCSGMTTEMSGPDARRWWRSCTGARTCCSSAGSRMFFLWANPLSTVLVAIVIVLLVYFLEIWIDNNFARVKWQFMLQVGVARGPHRRRRERRVPRVSVKEVGTYGISHRNRPGSSTTTAPAATAATSRC